MAWWASCVVLFLASVIDLCTRRIPNWLVLPFLIAGVVVRTLTGGAAGTGQSLAGIGIAVLVFGIPCFIRAMGPGDLKLAAGVGAWIGPRQFAMAFVVTAIVGGIMAICYAVRHRSLDKCLDSTGELVAHLAKGRIPAHADIGSAGARAISIPYAPAIAIGTLFSFFMR